MSWRAEAGGDTLSSRRRCCPLGGGSYAHAESNPIPMLKKGYYLATVEYTNIDYPGVNAARLEVQLGGSPITIGQLETHNILDSEKTADLLSFYAPMSYIDEDGEPSEVDIWGLFDKTNLNSPDLPGNVSGNTVSNLMQGENTCATRVSMALSRSGFSLRGYQGANFVHDLGGSLNDPDVGAKWHNACLRPDGIHDETDTTAYSHFFSSADALGAYLEATFDAPDYTSLQAYLDESSIGTDVQGATEHQDVIIFHNPYDPDRGWGHVGIGTSSDYAEGNLMENIDETNIWILKRASWGEPDTN